MEVNLEEAPRLTEAEWNIMLLLGDSPPRTLMQLTRALESETQWTKHTVLALLKRMMEKGTVRAEESGRTKLFYPNVPKEQVMREQTDRLMKRLFGGKALLMVSNVVESGKLSESELDELSALIAQARGKE